MVMPVPKSWLPQTPPADEEWDASRGIGDWRARLQRIYDAEAAADAAGDSDVDGGGDDDGDDDDDVPDIGDGTAALAGAALAPTDPAPLTAAEHLRE
jgi:hypothetical protein